MQNSIAVVGWGSLIWDLENLTPHVHGMWQHRAGPELPLEFSRISPKRKRGLAVCIDLMDGVPCMTSIIASRRPAMVDARRDLARRERAPDGFIGGVCLSTGQTFGRPQVVYKVWDWCTRAGWQGAVWTDLTANFTAERGIMFTVEDAVAYVKTLEGESLTEAVRYIHLAPQATNTRLRRALRDDAWWQEQVAALA